MFSHRNNQPLLLLTLVLALGGCATMNPPSATGPRNEPAYPIFFSKDDVREEAGRVALRRLSQRLGNFRPANAKLQPITGTIAGLPVTTTPLYLPKLGVEPVMNEEETRESLRRFIRDWQELIGSDPAKLSLVDRVDNPNGLKIAGYEQRVFRYPIRGHYGKLQIGFTSDRRIQNVSSTCIPDAERLQLAMAGAIPKLKPEEAIAVVRENEIPYTDTNGANLMLRVPASVTLTPRELVIYIVPSKTRPDTLEFHVCWEIELSGAPVKFVYVDALNGAIVAAG
jgi:hypothetical protein